MSVINKSLNVNPNMGSELFHDVLQFLEQHRGYITKCKDQNDRVIGYLVRIESDKYPDTVFINYKQNKDNKNIYFNKASAIVQTMKKGNRTIENALKNGISSSLDYNEMSFSKQLIPLKDITLYDDKMENHGSLVNFLDKNYLTFDDLDEIVISKEGAIIDKYLYEYMINFENKGRKYYKGNASRKKFVTLKVTI